MSSTQLIFIFVSVLQAVIFGFTIVLIRMRTSGTSNPSITGYSESAAIKLAELEGQINQLKMGFNDVIDRVENWTKRDSQRETRAAKKAELVLPTDPVTPVVQPSEVGPAVSGHNDQFAKLRAIRGY